MPLGVGNELPPHLRWPDLPAASDVRIAALNRQRTLQQAEVERFRKRHRHRIASAECGRRDTPLSGVECMLFRWPDEKPPAVASGIRLGTPIVSTRGMRKPEMKEIVDLVDRVLRQRNEPPVLEEVRIQAKALCDRFPIFHSY